MTFQCRNKRSYTLLNKLCNNVYDCPDGSDELFCELEECSKYCTCTDFKLIHCQNSINISSKNLKNFKYLKIENLTKIYREDEEQIMFNIVALSISNSKANLTKNLLKIFYNLVYLNISMNNIKEFSSKELKNQKMIQNLDLSYNYLKNLTKFSFIHLINLLTLNISYNNLIYISNNAFSNQISLKKLIIIQENQFIHLSKKAFKNLKNLQILIMEFNLKNDLTKIHLIQFNFLKKVFVKKFKSCCLFKKMIRKKNFYCYYKINKQLICFDYKFNEFRQNSIIFLFVIIIFSILLKLIFIFKFNIKINLQKFYKIFMDFIISIYLLTAIIYFYEMKIDDHTINFKLKILCLFIRIFYILILNFTVSMIFFYDCQSMKFVSNEKKALLLTLFTSLIFIIMNFVLILKENNCSIIIFHLNQFLNHNLKYFTYFFTIFISFLLVLTKILFVFIIFKIKKNMRKKILIKSTLIYLRLNFLVCLLIISKKIFFFYFLILKI